MARIDGQDLSSLPPQSTNAQRGRHLRLLLQERGIDVGRLYHLAYYPHRRCWLLTQEAHPGAASSALSRPRSRKEDEAFYLQTLDDLRRTQRAALAGHLGHAFYRSQQGPYELPQKPHEMTTADLTQLLGDAGTGAERIQFDGEGRWVKAPKKK
jgi:hypothetical protein